MAMVALKLVEVLIQAAHVYIVYILTDKNSQGCALRKNAREHFGYPTL